MEHSEVISSNGTLWFPKNHHDNLKFISTYLSDHFYDKLKDKPFYDKLKDKLRNELEQSKK